MLRMIAHLSCLLVSSCAALSPPPPLSADTRILLNTSDPSSVPACNRPALEVIALRRQEDKHDVPMALSDAWEMADVCAQREHELQEQVARHEWWDKYGTLVSVLSFGVGAAIGGWIGSGIERTRR